MEPCLRDEKAFCLDYEIQNVENIGIPTGTSCLEAFFTQRKQSYTVKYHRALPVFEFYQ